MTWTRYKQGKLFKTQINDPTVQGCPKCLVLLAKIQERCRSRKYMKWLDAILKFFYGKPDIYVCVCVCVCVRVRARACMCVHLTNNNFLIISN